jgi:pimeloyl-ACP methyl ester carboxylesterase
MPLRRVRSICRALLVVATSTLLHSCAPIDAAEPGPAAVSGALSSRETALRERLAAERIIDQPGTVSSRLCDTTDGEALAGAPFSSCEVLEIEFRGLKTQAFLFSRASRQLTIFHEGHNSPDRAGLRDALLPDARRLLTELLEFSDVLYFDMPLLGVNSGQSFVVKGRSTRATTHERFALVDEPGQSALAYFLNPIDLALDFVSGRYGSIKMIGRSGGGWTTTVYSALDPRIVESVSFAGTAPIAARSIDLDGRDDLGDWEQYGAAVYRWLDYEDLYALAASGGRSHEQVYLEFDNCCFSGLKGQESKRIFEAGYGMDMPVTFTILAGAYDHYGMPTALLAERMRN